MHLRKYHVVIELILVAAVAITGWLCVWPVFTALGEDRLEGRFGVVLHAFTAPAMFAAGHGMRNIDLHQFPELQAFYRIETSRFDTSLIPDDYEGYPLSGSYSYMHYYLLYAIGWAWRLFGISFYALHLLCAFLYALMIVVLYGIFRLGMGRLLSVAASLLAAASPAYLLSCPSLRDFGKAPFILGCFLLLGWLLKGRFTLRQLLAWAFFYALTAGIGYGFRQDLLICVPAGIAMVLFFAPVDAVRAVRARCLASVVLLGVFLLVASPVMRGVRLDHGSASAQAFTQGVSVAVENKQRFGHASYTMHADYSDYYDFTIVNHFARRQGDTTYMPSHFTEGHGQAGSRYMREVMRRFPGDMFARGLASLASLPGANRVAGNETGFITQEHGDFLRDRADLYAPLAAHFERWGLMYAILALTLLSISNIRLGIAAALLGVYFGAYPSLLYDFRHYFHLAFVPYWACGYLLTRAARFVVGFLKAAFRREGLLPPRRTIRKTALALLFLCSFAVALWAAAAILRTAQQRQVYALLDVLERAELEAVETVWTPEDEGWLLQPVDTLPEFKKTAALPGFESTGEYLMVALSHTGFPPIVRLLYEDRPMVNFSEWANPHPGLSGGDGRYRYYFPAYELVWPHDGDAAQDGAVRGKFKGLFVPGGQQDRVRGLYRIKDAHTISLWPHVAVPEDRDAFFTWKTGPLDHFFAKTMVELRSIFGFRSEAAVSGYMNLLRRWPDHACLQERIIRIIRRVRNPEKAFRLISQVLHDYPRLYPLISRDLEELIGAVALFSEVMPQDAWSKTVFGQHLNAQGRYEEAGKMYAEALALSPDFVLAAEGLDGYYQRMGDLDGRLRVWQTLHEDHPEACVPGLFLGIALRQAGRFDEAAACLSEILDNNLGCQDDVKFHLGASMIMNGQLERGRVMLEEALEMYPSKTWLAAGLHAEMGRFEIGRGGFDAAFAHFRLAMALEPENLWHQVGLADAYRASGEGVAAAQEYFDVLSQAPESPYSAYNLDEILTDTQDNEGRLQRWRQLTAMHPNAAVPMFYLGKALEAAGDFSGAKTAYRTALERNPELEEAHIRLERLLAREKM